MSKSIPHFITTHQARDDSILRLYIYETLDPPDGIAIMVGHQTRSEYATLETHLPKANIPHLIAYLSQFVEEEDGA